MALTEPQAATRGSRASSSRRLPPSRTMCPSPRRRGARTRRQGPARTSIPIRTIVEVVIAQDSLTTALLALRAPTARARPLVGPAPQGRGAPTEPAYRPAGQATAAVAAIAAECAIRRATTLAASAAVRATTAPHRAKSVSRRTPVPDSGPAWIRPAGHKQLRRAGRSVRENLLADGSHPPKTGNCRRARRLDVWMSPDVGGRHDRTGGESRCRRS